MNVTERRKSPRIKIHNLISFTFLDNAGRPIKHLKGTVLNLSQGGILIQTTQRIEPGKVILIKPGNVILITADEQDKIFEIIGRAAYCREIGDRTFFVGISFQGKNDENIQFNKPSPPQGAGYSLDGFYRFYRRKQRGIQPREIKCLVRAHHYRRASAQLN